MTLADDIAEAGFEAAELSHDLRTVDPEVSELVAHAARRLLQAVAYLDAMYGED